METKTVNDWLKLFDGSALYRHDLFSSVREEAADYGEPFLPCTSCGQCHDHSCMILDGQLVSPWTMDTDGPRCLECGAPLRNISSASMEGHEKIPRMGLRWM